MKYLIKENSSLQLDLHYISFQKQFSLLYSCQQVFLWLLNWETKYADTIKVPTKHGFPNLLCSIYVCTMPCIFWKQALKERLSNNTTFSMPCTINDKNNLNFQRKGFCLWLKVHLILSFLLSTTFTSPLVPLQKKKYRSDSGTRLCFKFWIQISLITTIRR